MTVTDNSYNEYLSKVKGSESGGDQYAKNPKSSASGLYQFTKGTWEGLGYNWKDRFDTGLQNQAMGKLTNINASYLKSKLGIVPTDADLYGAHFLGPQGYASVYKTSSNTPLSSVLPSGAISANPFLKGKTTGDLKNWLSKKMGQPAVNYGDPEPSVLPAKLEYDDSQFMMYDNYEALTPEQRAEFDAFMSTHGSSEDKESTEDTEVSEAKNELLQKERERSFLDELNSQYEEAQQQPQSTNQQQAPVDNSVYSMPQIDLPQYQAPQMPEYEEGGEERVPLRVSPESRAMGDVGIGFGNNIHTSLGANLQDKNLRAGLSYGKNKLATDINYTRGFDNTSSFSGSASYNPGKYNIDFSYGQEPEGNSNLSLGAGYRGDKLSGNLEYSQNNQDRNLSGNVRYGTGNLSGSLGTNFVLGQDFNPNIKGNINYQNKNFTTSIGAGYNADMGIQPNISAAYRFQDGGIPDRYKNAGFTKVGAKKQSTRPGKKWMVLAKKGDQYKIVHGGYDGMKDFSQHGSKDRKERFWDRMGGRDSAKANDPFSPLYWHKRFGTWAEGGEVDLPQYQTAGFSVEGKKPFTAPIVYNNKQNGYTTKRDSVAHQADKILEYEQLRGGPGGAPLPEYADPVYRKVLMNSIYPQVQKIMPKASAMEIGEAMDFIFNAGWDKDKNKITKDPRAFALQEYYKQYDPSKLDKDGTWAGRKNAPYSFDQEYNNTIGKLPENQRRILMNRGRDWYYQNTAPKGSTWDLKTQGPHPNYSSTWYGRIHNTNDYKPFNPNNPKFTKKEIGGYYQDGGLGKNVRPQKRKAYRKASEMGLIDPNTSVEKTLMDRMGVRNFQKNAVDNAYEMGISGNHNGGLDAIRHASSAAKVASTMPFGVGFVAANALGAAHEADSKINWRETASDMYNNFAGSLVGSIPFIDDSTRQNIIIEAQKRGILHNVNQKAPQRREDGGYYENGGYLTQSEQIPLSELKRIYSNNELIDMLTHMSNGGSYELPKYEQGDIYEGDTYGENTYEEDAYNTNPIGVVNPQNKDFKVKNEADSSTTVRSTIPIIGKAKILPNDESKKIKPKYKIKKEEYLAVKDVTPNFKNPQLEKQLKNKGVMASIDAQATKNISELKDIDPDIIKALGISDVMSLQKKLYDLGYDLGAYGKNKDGVDGKFGKMTKKALEEFKITGGSPQSNLSLEQEERIARLRKPEQKGFLTRTTEYLDDKQQQLINSAKGVASEYLPYNLQYNPKIDTVGPSNETEGANKYLLDNKSLADIRKEKNISFLQITQNKGEGNSVMPLQLKDRVVNSTNPQGYAPDTTVDEKGKTQFEFFDRLASEESKDKQVKRLPGVKGNRREDIYRMYSGLPQKYDTFTASSFKAGSNSDTNITFKNPEDVADYIKIAATHTDLFKRLANGEITPETIARDKNSDKKGGEKINKAAFRDPKNVMWNATFGIEFDKKGNPYLSFYDNWDLKGKDDIGGFVKDKVGVLRYTPQGAGIVAAAEKVGGAFGKPIEIYDKIPLTQELIKQMANLEYKADNSGASDAVPTDDKFLEKITRQIAESPAMQKEYAKVLAQIKQRYK